MDFKAIFFSGIFVCNPSGEHSYEDVEKVEIIPWKI
jgi:hypothetical protein